jgi:chromodomain-helicase-DNA-binding protein 4
MQKRPAHAEDVSGDEFDSEEVPDSEEQTEDDDDDYEDANTHELRRSSRTATTGSRKKTIKNLPFSPKKTRSRKVDGDSDDELAGFDQEQSSEVVEIPTRRSTRARKSAKANLADEEYEDEGDEEDDDSSTRRRHKRNREVKKRKPPRAKASRPAYGTIRDVADLDYDPYSDDETLPLRAHRDECEKCRKQPVHKLLLAVKTKPKGRRRKKTSDDEDDEGNEEERLTALGGWVRW